MILQSTEGDPCIYTRLVIICVLPPIISRDKCQIEAYITVLATSDFNAAL